MSRSSDRTFFGDTSGGGGPTPLGVVAAQVTATQQITAQTPVAITGLAPAVFTVTDRPWLVEGHIHFIATAATAGSRTPIAILQSTTDLNAVYSTAYGVPIDPAGAVINLPSMSVSTLITTPGSYSIRLAFGRNGTGSLTLGSATSSPGLFPSPTILVARELPL